MLYDTAPLTGLHVSTGMSPPPVGLFALGDGAGSTRLNVATDGSSSDQRIGRLLTSLARTRQYSSVSVGYVFELVYAVESVVTSSKTLLNVGSLATCSV